MCYSAGQSQRYSPPGLKFCICWLKWRQVTVDFCMLVGYPWEGSSSSNTMRKPLISLLPCRITKLTADSETNTLVWVTKHLHSDEIIFFFTLPSTIPFMAIYSMMHVYSYAYEICFQLAISSLRRWQGQHFSSPTRPKHCPLMGRSSQTRHLL